MVILAGTYFLGKKSSINKILFATKSRYRNFLTENKNRKKFDIFALDCDKINYHESKFIGNYSYLKQR